MNTPINLLRNGLGGVISLIDKATRPTPLQRTPDQQARVEQELKKLSVYQFKGCPFCVKTRRAMHLFNLPIELRDAKQSPWRKELMENGGKLQVPCLRIDREDGTPSEWMYESSDIIRYLETRFVQAETG